MTATPHRCRLVLVTAPDSGGVERAAAALAVADFATLIVSPPRAGATLVAAEVKPIIELAQARNIAALVADDAQLARALGADGVHVTWSDDVAARHRGVREILGPRYIAGAEAGRSRHVAMELGEANADYIAFGIPPHVEDRATARERRRDLVRWWAEIFEPPVVAFDAETAGDAAVLADAGADFVAVTLPEQLLPGDVAAWLAPYSAGLTDTRVSG